MQENLSVNNIIVLVQFVAFTRFTPHLRSADLSSKLLEIFSLFKRKPNLVKIILLPSLGNYFPKHFSTSWHTVVLLQIKKLSLRNCGWKQRVNYPFLFNISNQYCYRLWTAVQNWCRFVSRCNIDRSLRAVWLVKKPMFYHSIKHIKSVHYCFSPHHLYIIKQMKESKPCIITLW